MTFINNVSEQFEFIEKNAASISTKLDEIDSKIKTLKDSPEHSILQIYKDIQTTEKHIENGVKILKRSLKGETNVDTVSKNKDLLLRIQGQYESIITEIREVGKTTNFNNRKVLKAFQENLARSSDILSTLKEVTTRTESKETILNRKFQISRVELQTSPVKIERFDHWINNQVKLDGENESIYQHLAQIVQKTRFKQEGTVNNEDLHLLNRIRNGNSNNKGLLISDHLRNFFESYTESRKLQFELIKTLIDKSLKNPSFLKGLDQKKLTEETISFLLHLNKYANNENFPPINHKELCFLFKDSPHLLKILDFLGDRSPLEKGGYASLFDAMMLLKGEDFKELLLQNRSLESTLEIEDSMEYSHFLKELNNSEQFDTTWKKSLREVGIDRRFLISALDSYSNSLKEDEDHPRHWIRDIKKGLEGLEGSNQSLEHNGIRFTGFSIPSQSLSNFETSLFSDFKLTLYNSIHLKIDPKQAEQFSFFIDELIEEIEQTKARKLDLLDSLYKDIRLEKRIQPDLSEEKKLKFLIHYRQIMDNPLEMPLDLPEQKELFRDLLPRINDPTFLILPSEQTLQFKIEGLQRMRNQALNDPKKGNDNILISGAGPGGLMMGLISALQGKDFTIIESRAQDAQMRENVLALGKEDDPSNLKMLQTLHPHGQFQAADLKLLDFLGITDSLFVESKTIKADDLLNVKIKDLQEAMKTQIGILTENQDIIHYNTEIGDVILPKLAHGFAKVELKTAQRALGDVKGLVTTVEPTQVYVMEGYRTTTRDLLGIEAIKESKVARLAFALFDSKKTETLNQKFVQILKNIAAAFRFMPLIFKLLAEMKGIRSNIHTEEYTSMFKVLGRGELLLSTPETDYFYYTVSEEEKKEIGKFQEQIKNLQQMREFCFDTLLEKIKRHKTEYSLGSSLDSSILKTFEDLEENLDPANRKQWYQNFKKMESVFKSLSEVAQVMPNEILNSEERKAMNLAQSELKKGEKQISKIQRHRLNIEGQDAKRGRRRMNLINRLKNGSSLREMNYQRTLSADSQVQRVDTNYRQLGDSHFYVGGDAESATDPMSGSGFRTTILRALVASDSLKSAKQRNNRFNQSIFEWSTNLGSKSMREEGMDLRRFVVSGTERLERYIGIAEHEGILDATDRNLLLQFESKAKNTKEGLITGLTLGKEEKNHLDAIKQKLKNSYTHGTLAKTLAIPRRHLGWTKKEERIFKEALNALTSSTKVDLNDEEMKIFKSAVGKIALYREDSSQPELKFLEEAWYVPLLVSIQQMETNIRRL
jgi:hypothetical protein